MKTTTKQSAVGVSLAFEKIVAAMLEQPDVSYIRICFPSSDKTDISV